MDLNKINTKKILFIGSFIVILYWTLQNLSEVLGWGAHLLGILAPIFVGIGIAFIINVPMKLIENTVLSKAKNLKRPLSLVLAIIVLITIILLVLTIIIPELIRTVLVMRDSIPGFLIKAEDFIEQIAKNFPEIGMQINDSINWTQFGKNMLEMVQKGATVLIGSTFSIVASTFNGVFTFFLGFVLAIYILLQKEKLAMQFKRVFYAHFHEKIVDKIIYIFSLTNRAFTNFFTGQCLEAVILGFMFFVTMSIFKLPYALMISVTIGFTALIPIFGAFIGCFIGAFLILITNPLKVIWFLLMFIILQQVEGNLIYPRVVGSSVGLPGIWVLLAVTIGGSLMGILGMLVMVPISSVIYILLRESTNKHLKIREIKEEKLLYSYKK